MSTRIHYFQHVPYEDLGNMAEEFRQRGSTLSVTRWYQGDSAPQLDDFDWLIIMGGPMNVDDEAHYPWLKAEKALIRAAVDAGKVVLGVCLGAQLVARVLGAQVVPMAQREIGWFPVMRQPAADDSILSSVLPERFEAFHWHGDRFELPEGALLLASSEACDQQIFSYGSKVFGFQCHLEFTPKQALGLLENCRDELDGSRYVQSAEEITASEERFAGPNRLLTRVFDALVASH